MNTGDNARDVSVVTSHASRATLTTGHNQCMMAERFDDVGHWSVWLYFVLQKNLQLPWCGVVIR